MYRLFSSQVILDNLVVLVMPYIQDKNAIDMVSLKKAYRDFLYTYQPHCPYIYEEKLFHADVKTEETFSSYFAEDEFEIIDMLGPDPSEVIMYPDAEVRKSALENSLKELETTDPIFVELFKLVMNTVFCTPSPNLGGTSVNPYFMAVMCAHHDMKAEKKAIPELLIHEFTHNALFLDELRYGHFDYKKMSDPAMQLDAIDDRYKFRFPFHRCLHSLIVNAEILLARDAYIGHTPLVTQHLTSKRIVERAKKYIANVAAIPEIQNCITDRAKYLYETCVKFYESYS